MTFWAMLGFAAVLIGALFLANNLQPRQSAASSVRDRGGMERGFGTGLLVLIVGYSGSVVRAATVGHVSANAAYWITLIAHFGVVIAVAVLFIGVWRFYRPASPIAAAGVFAGIGAVFASWAIHGLRGVTAEPRNGISASIGTGLSYRYLSEAARSLPPLLTETHRYDRSNRNFSMESRRASPCQREGETRAISERRV